MSQIDNPALDYPAGKEFDYSVWEPGTQIDLCNVPWDAQYRHVWMPGSDNDTPAQRRAALNAYIDNLQTPHTVINGGMPVRVDVPVRVGMSHNIASRYNYLRARNKQQPSSTGPDIARDFYYFIIGTRYINPGTTELILQLDVWQSYIYDVVVGNSYIERGHVGMANENRFDSWGREYLTVPEGLDTGGELRIVHTSTELIQDDQTVRYNVLLCATVDFEASEGPDGELPLATAPGGMIQGIPSGAKYYIMESGSQLLQYMEYWKDKPWLTQSIISITIIPPVKRFIPGYDITNPSVDKLADAPPELNNSHRTKMLPDWRNSNQIRSSIPARYRNLEKLFTFPYMVIEITTFTGTPIILKPELWNAADADLIERMSIVPPGQRYTVFPRYYNVTGTFDDQSDAEDPSGSSYYGDDPGEYYDLATHISSFPSVAIVNNSYAGYLANNQNAIGAQYAGADWSQQRALRGAQLGYDQSMSGINAMRQQTEAQTQFAGATQQVQQELARQNQWMAAIGGTAMSGAAGLAGGPIGGGLATAGGLGSGILNALTLNNNIDAANQQLRHQTNQAFRSTDISAGQSQYVADSNKAYAEWGARGDYEQAIASMDAKTQDARMLQPTVSGQMGGDFLQLIYGGYRIAARWKMIDEAAIATVGEHWLEFGYAVHRRTTPPPSLKVMTKFTYWRMVNAVILSAPMPEGFKNAIRGILEKGVTVWDKPDDIGRIDFATNTPKNGISL